MIKLRIQVFQNDLTDTYEEFVKTSINGTIFHERKFLSYHPEDRFKDNSLLIYNKSKLIAVFPAALIVKQDKKILKSHPGTSYGGIVIKENLNYEIIDAIYEKIEEYCIENGINYIEFRHSPKIFFNNPIDQLDFALVRRNYIREAEELSTFYSLKEIKGLNETDYINYYNNYSSTKSRQNIKKAISLGVKLDFIENKNEIDKFYLILQDNLKKYNTSPVHSKDEIIKLLELYPNRVKIAVSKIDNKILGGFLIFNINKNGWHIFYSCLDYNLLEYKAIHFCLFSLKKHLSELSYKYLNYGISTENSGKYVNKSLLKFKESFNGMGIVRTYWQKKLDE